MITPLSFARSIVLGRVVAALSILSFLPQAGANVYPTQVRLNGSFSDISVTAGTGVRISYTLNEAATAGVIIRISSGDVVLRNLTLAAGAAGTSRGTNTVTWDGKDDLGRAVGAGSYSVSVSAAATGYADWTQINNDTNASSYVWDPRGIAINQNMSSPYYGRVFVANAVGGPGSKPGDQVGILKFNSDGSYASEGAVSPVPAGFTPWKLEVADDRVYVNDFGANGIVLSFDQTVSDGSRREVLREDNWPNTAVELNGPLITTSGTNSYIWMADTRQSGVGIRRWLLQPDGTVATNDIGSTIIRSDTLSDLNVAPYDLAADPSNRIYTIQSINAKSSSSPRLLRFPPYDESGVQQSFAEWKVGANDDLLTRAAAVSVSPSGDMVAASFLGTFIPPFGPWENGSVRVFAASNGVPIATVLPVSSPSHDYFDLSWDRAGNLYVVDATDSVWRMFSPPGPNESTTVAIARVNVTGSSSATAITGVALSGGNVTLTIQGQPNVTYNIIGSTNFGNWQVVATSPAGAAVRTVTFPAPSSDRFFYDVVAASSVPTQPLLSGGTLAGTTFRFTLQGQAGATYVVESSPDLAAWTPVLTNTESSASRIITIPASAPRSFFRVKQP